MTVWQSKRCGLKNCIEVFNDDITDIQQRMETASNEDITPIQPDIEQDSNCNNINPLDNISEDDSTEQFVNIEKEILKNSKDFTQLKDHILLKDNENAVKNEMLNDEKKENSKDKTSSKDNENQVKNKILDYETKWHNIPQELQDQIESYVPEINT